MSRKRILVFVAIAIGLWLAIPGATVSPEDINNLNGGRVLRIGHGGMGFASLISPYNPLPANSAASIDKLLAMDADGIEVDVQMSADSIFILYHDQELGSQTSGTGCIGDQPADGVLGLNYSGFPYSMFHSEKVISLETLLEKMKGMEEFPYLFLDLHSFNYCREDPYEDVYAYADQLATLLSTYEVPKDKVWLISTYDYLLTALLKQNEDWQLVYESTKDMEDGITMVSRYGFAALIVADEIATEEGIAAAHKQRIPVITFGGTGRGNIATMLRKGPDMVHVDNMDALNKVLQQ